MWSFYRVNDRFSTLAEVFPEDLLVIAADGDCSIICTRPRFPLQKKGEERRGWKHHSIVCRSYNRR